MDDDQTYDWDRRRNRAPKARNEKRVFGGAATTSTRNH
jgi:hypothetical protein